MRKTTHLMAVFLLACAVCTNANAWFFFFIPGSVTDKIGDALTGAEGDSCVSATAKVGDVIRSPSGNSATVKSLSGTWSRCQNPALPVRALLSYNHSFTSKAGINIPDGFEQKPLTDMQRFQGNVLKAEDSTGTGFLVSAQPRTTSTDAPGIARAIGARMTTTLDDSRTSNEEDLTINGMHALRFEVEGKAKGLFGRRYSYVVTLLEGPQELLIINAWTPTNDIARKKEALRQLIFNVEGLSPTLMPAAAVAVPLTAPMPGSEPSVAEVTPNSQIMRLPPSGTPPAAESGPSSVANKLRDLDKLYKEGVITQKEYETKKEELLKAL